MKGTEPVLSEQDGHLHAIDLRRDARKVVGLRAIVADKLGLASGAVTNISPGGCGLRLTKRLRCGQYITLIIDPNDRTAAVYIDLAKVNWVEAEWAGVEFLGVSPQNHELHRLCREQDVSPSKSHSASFSEADRASGTESPTKSGVYWFQSRTMARALMVEVRVMNGELTVWWPTQDEQVANLKGHWKGPIPPSSGPESH